MNITFSAPAEVDINGITIHTDLLSKVDVNVVPAIRERSTMAGKFKRNAGTLDTSEAKFTMFLPNIDYLKNIVPDQYAPGTGAQLTGNVIWGVGSCTVANTPVNIHPACNKTDDNDIYFYAGQVVMSFNPSLNATDEATVEVTVYGNPDDNGNVVRVGTGDLTQPSEYDAVSETTVPIGS